MRYVESNGNDTRNRNRKDYESIFDRVTKTYIEVISLPDLASSRFDGQAKRTLTAGTTALDFKIDVELSNKRVLTSPELHDEWRRLVRAQIAAATSSTNPTQTPPPVPAEQRALTNRVIALCGRIYARKGLAKPSYFTRTRQRSER
jgi:hypothetical protein